jgi:hypothetical protein
MACGCSRLTFKFQCQHKERKADRCYVYSLQERGSYLACCFPRCRTEYRRHDVKGVCHDCRGFFYEKYGQHMHKQFIQYFLAYKESRGWGDQKIDPRTVPREVLLNRASAPAALGRQPFQAHQPMSDSGNYGMSMLQPMPGYLEEQRERVLGAEREDGSDSVQEGKEKRKGQAANPGSARERDSSLESIDITRQAVVADGSQTPSPVSKTFVSKVSGGAPFANVSRPLPADPSLFAVGDDEDEDEDEYSEVPLSSPSPIMADCPRVSSPQPKYTRDTLPRGMMVPELAHLAARGQIRKVMRHRPQLVGTPELQHPMPKAATLRHLQRRHSVDSMSDISLVKRLTKQAETIEIPRLTNGYIEYEPGKFVPLLDSVPRGRRCERIYMRAPTPTANECKENDNGAKDIPIALEANAVPSSPVLDEPKGSTKSAKYVVRAHRSPSRESVAVPPPRRLDGVLIPSSATCPAHSAAHLRGDRLPINNCRTCRGAFFRERGVPSEAHVEEESRSAAFAGPRPPVVVSVSAPRRRYSCAVQSCYCDYNSRKTGDKCPSCRERDIIADKLNVGWI